MFNCFTRSLVLLGVLADVTLSFAEDWTEFRGPRGDGRVTATGLPVKWSETEHVRWKAPLPGVGWACPVVAGGRIYLADAIAVPGKDGAKETYVLAMHGIDAASGKILWTKEVFDQVPGPAAEKHPENSHASATPILEGDRLYVHFGNQGTACLTTAGEVLWTTRELQYFPQHGNGGSPASFEDLLIICCDGRGKQFVTALEKKTGKPRWTVNRDAKATKGFSFCTPLIIDVDGQPQAICPGSSAVFAYNPRTGEEIWRVRYGQGYSVVPRPITGHGLVYICTGFDSASLLAIDPHGTGDLTDTNIKWRKDEKVPYTPSLLLVGDELYSVDDKGIANCLDAKTGKVHWTHRVTGDYWASPLYADGHIYLQNKQGVGTVLIAGKSFEEVSVNELAGGQERSYASYSVIDHSWLIRTEHNLYRIDP